MVAGYHQFRIGSVNLCALISSRFNKLHIFQCMGKMFCVEFQRVPLKFQTKYLTHTLKDTILIQCRKFKCSHSDFRTRMCLWNALSGMVKFKLVRWCNNSTKSWKYSKEIISHLRPLSWLWIKKLNQRNVICFKNQSIFLTKYLIGMKWLSLIMITTTKLLLLMIIMMIWTCFASFI